MAIEGMGILLSNLGTTVLNLYSVPTTSWFSFRYISRARHGRFPAINSAKRIAWSNHLYKILLLHILA
jgi:hypothetical protein